MLWYHLIATIYKFETRQPSKVSFQIKSSYTELYTDLDYLDRVAILYYINYQSKQSKLKFINYWLAPFNVMLKVCSSVEDGLEVLGLLAFLDAGNWNQRTLCLHQVVLQVIMSMFST